MITIVLNTKRQAKRLIDLLNKGLAYDDAHIPRNITDADDRLIKYINKQINL